MAASVVAENELIAYAYIFAVQDICSILASLWVPMLWGKRFLLTTIDNESTE